MEIRNVTVLETSPYNQLLATGLQDSHERDVIDHISFFDPLTDGTMQRYA